MHRCGPRTAKLPRRVQQQGAKVSLAQVHSRALMGLQARLVTVEVHLANGLPSFTMLAP